MSAAFSEAVTDRRSWLTKGESRGARSMRSKPPSQRPPVSPPTIATVPVGVRARRRRASEALPPMSTITS